MAIVVGWLIFAILVGVYAEKRGRNGVGYFLVSLVLSPLIGFIIVLLVGAKRDVVEEQLEISGEMKKCPFCAEMIRVQAIKCRYCGTDLPAKTSAQRNDGQRDDRPVMP